TNHRVAALFEGRFVEAEQAEALLDIQESILDSAGQDPDLLYLFGRRWAQRHLPEAAVPLLVRALDLEPKYPPAVTFLATWGREDETIRKGLFGVADRASTQSGSLESLSYLLASAALVALRDVNNMQQANEYFARLAAVAPSHPALAEHRAGQGESAEPSTS